MVADLKDETWNEKEKRKVYNTTINKVSQRVQFQKFGQGAGMQGLPGSDTEVVFQVGGHFCPSYICHSYNTASYASSSP